jgi:excinuclease ABC subunit A
MTGSHFQFQSPILPNFRKSTVTSSIAIELEGVRVNNLKNIGLQIRRNAVTVICGVSGSGKSSLAFDTLYAEGQRRYIETFSTSVRHFLDRIERPAVDRIIGLPPAIAIRQHLRGDSPRSTVGTRSEILDALRVLFARVGTTICPDCKREVRATSPEAATQHLLTFTPTSRLQILAPVQMSPHEVPHKIAELIRSGFTRAVCQGRVTRLEELSVKNVEGSILIVVDRLKADGSNQQRIVEAIHSAMTLVDGRCVVLADAILSGDPGDGAGGIETQTIDGVDWRVFRFSGRHECSNCHRVFAEPSPELLSFTSPLGACSHCQGTGQEPTAPKRTVGSVRQSINNGHCRVCRGRRLNEQALCLRWAAQTIVDVGELELGELSDWLEHRVSELPPGIRTALSATIDFLQRRMLFLRNCGLDYLSLNRSMKSLSAGEAQRVLLTSAIAGGLCNTLYVLDEPSAGLHSSDTDRVLSAIRNLRDTGNTVVVVEHDPAVILAADDVIEIGPEAGDHGGTVVFQGSPDQLLAAETVTAIALRADRTLENPAPADQPRRSKDKRGPRVIAKSGPERTTATRRIPEQWLELQAIECHNIREVTAKLPLGIFCAVIGVSGSGKSSLVTDTLYPILSQHLGKSVGDHDGRVSGLSGADQLDNVVLLDQSPLRRSRRSIPATWIGVFDDLRIVLSETHEARKRNYSRSMFSFNASSGGRCSICEGQGVVSIPMQFLADIETTCEECGGKRFRPEVLEIRYRDRSIDDILNMTADDAFSFFSGHHRIQQRLNALRQAGLGYLRLGQPLKTLSGGESQRLRIATMLAGLPMQEGEKAAENRKPAAVTTSGRTLFVLDEPSVGLHLRDIERLAGCLDFLIQTGNSVIIADHDPALIRHADWLIELGPGPGKLGGQVVSSRLNSDH